MLSILWILLPIAVLVGWLAAKRDKLGRQRFLYYLSLRYLLDTNSNNPENIGEKLSELPPSYQDNSTILSLTLGDVFRKKGEIERAISIHQYIASSDTIDLAEKKTAQWSLALDFIAAGLLDRAEDLLRELIPESEFTQRALLKLTHIYEQQHDWLQAISCLERLDLAQDHYAEIAHLYCELAEENLQNNAESALSFAHAALNIYPNSARASLIIAFIAIKNNDQLLASTMLSAIENQSINLTPLIAPIMQYIHKDQPEIFLIWLENTLMRHPHIILFLMKTHYLIMHESAQAALSFLEQTLLVHPNFQGLLNFHQLNKWLYPNKNIDKNKTDIYAITFDKIVDHYAKYRCQACGFVSKSLNWHCPSCQAWDTASPVADIISLKSLSNSPGA